MHLPELMCLLTFLVITSINKTTQSPHFWRLFPSSMYINLVHWMSIYLLYLRFVLNGAMIARSKSSMKTVVISIYINLTLNLLHTYIFVYIRDIEFIFLLYISHVNSMYSISNAILVETDIFNVYIWNKCFVELFRMLYYKPPYSITYVYAIF